MSADSSFPDNSTGDGMAGRSPDSTEPGAEPIGRTHACSQYRTPSGYVQAQVRAYDERAREGARRYAHEETTT